MVTNGVTGGKSTRRRGELARALDAAFSDCDQWTVVGPRRRGADLPAAAENPIAVAQAERSALDAAERAASRH
jgi:hypothetical protein